MSNTNIERCTTFTQTVTHGGKVIEDYVEVSINIYVSQKIESSLMLPPYLDCATQFIARAHCQLLLGSLA